MSGIIKKRRGRRSSKELPLLGHLLELRERLLWSLLFFVVMLGVVYPFSQEILGILIRPLEHLQREGAERRLIYTGLPEAFLTYVKVALFGAFALSIPFFAFQTWKFVAPGLYQKEQHAFFSFLIAAPGLFILGASFAFYGVIPGAWNFFLSYETPAVVTGLPIQLEARLSEYLSLTLQMMMAFGLCFELPLILLILGRLGWVQSSSLAKGRRYAFVLILVAAALLTPPDVLSMIALATPLYALYELSIILLNIQEKNIERTGE